MSEQQSSVERQVLTNTVRDVKVLWVKTISEIGLKPDRFISLDDFVQFTVERHILNDTGRDIDLMLAANWGLATEIQLWLRQSPGKTLEAALTLVPDEDVVNRILSYGPWRTSD